MVPPVTGPWDAQDTKLRELALATAEDQGTDMAYYDRKEDSELSADDLERLVKIGIVTVEELAAAFVKGMGL